MPKIRKVKRRKSFKVNINRKRLRNKLRKLPAIECKDIKDAWENTKSTRQNLGDMGLAYDANKALKIPSFKREILARAKRNTVEDSENVENAINVPPKSHVAMNLEAEAKAPRERNFRLPNQQVQFITYLMDKYGDDHKAMSRDKKNHYQLTWRQIRAKINTFKGIPEQYAEYLLKNGEIILDDPETLVETKKRIANENIAKFCAPKPKKVKAVTSQWLEESLDDIDFDKGDKLEDVDEYETETFDGVTKQSEKKLKLFSDDESEDDEKKGSKLKKSKTRVENLKKQRKESNEGVGKNGKMGKALEKLASSDSESEEEFEGNDDDNEAGFVDLNDLTDEELSDDDILDNGEFVTDSDESD